MDFSLDASIATQAEAILEPLDLTDDEINTILAEWNTHVFERGQVTRMMAKLQRISHDFILKKHGIWEEYLLSRKRRFIMPFEGYHEGM